MPTRPRLPRRPAPRGELDSVEPPARRTQILLAYAAVDVLMIVLTRTAGRSLNKDYPLSNQLTWLVIVGVTLVFVSRGSWLARSILLCLTAVPLVLLVGALGNQPSWYLLSLTVLSSLQLGLLLRACPEIALPPRSVAFALPGRRPKPPTLADET